MPGIQRGWCAMKLAGTRWKTTATYISAVFWCWPSARMLLRCGRGMNSVSLLKIRTVNPKAVNAKSHNQDNVKPKFRPISLLSVLEAENFQLRQALVELSLDTLMLRDALKELD
jgi:hypothetical protein